MKKRVEGRMIKGVFFDAGGTLFDVKGGVGIQYSRIAGKHGVQVDPLVLNNRFKKVFELTRPLAFPGAGEHERNGLERNWWRQVVRQVFEGIPFPSFEAFFDEVYFFFAGPEGWVLFSETIEVLEGLHARSYYIGVISNFDSRLESICQALNISRYFSEIFFSSRHGMAKPSPEIFAAALGAANISPSESIYVGDSIHNDIRGALSIGMKPLLVDRTNDHREREDIDRISSLRGVFRYI
ncbi:MAG: HAD-IA family hydrolase [Nitrospira sp.]